MTARWPLVLNGTTIQELQTGDTLNGVSSFDTGTAMLFVQTTAPTGWTKSTTHNDKALRVVSGTASSGGTYTFSSTFANGNTGAFTLSTSEMPSHTHVGGWATGSGGAGGIFSNPGSFSNQTTSPNNTGGGGSHAHSLSLAVAYVDVIICTKN